MSIPALRKPKRHPRQPYGPTPATRTRGCPAYGLAVVVATGIAADGTREVLGLDVGDREDETFWRAFLLSLKQRGLGGVQLVISDQHSGLVAALLTCANRPNQ